MGSIAGIIRKGAKPIVGSIESMMHSIEHRNSIDQIQYLKEERLHLGYSRNPDHEPLFCGLGFAHNCVDGSIISNDEEVKNAVSIDGFCEGFFQNMAKIRGVFSLFLYDQNKRNIYIFKDHYGLKNVYWAEDENFMYFSSEIKAINMAFSCNEVSPSGIMEYLIYGLPLASRTMQKNIHTLKPGNVLQINLENFRYSLHTYYRPEDHLNQKNYVELKNLKENELVNKLDKLINKSVSESIKTERRAGVFLSGGVDSSLVTAILKSKNADILPCTVHLNEDVDQSELEYAQRAADHLSLTLKVVNFNRRVFQKNLIDTIYALESPLILENAVALYVASKELKDDGIDYIIDGEGADALFVGSTSLFKWYVNLFNFHRKSPLFSSMLESSVFRYSKILSKLGIVCKYPNPKDYQGLHLLIGGGGLDAYSEKNRLRELLPYIENKSEKEIIVELLNKFNGYLRPTFNRLIQSTISNGIEVRLPFMDQDLVDFSLNLPMKYKVGSKGIKPVPKYLLKKVAERYIPKSLIYRPKLGFSIPHDYIGNIPVSWFKSGFIPTTFDLSSKQLQAWWNSSDTVKRDRFFYASIEIWGQLFIQNRPLDEVDRSYLAVNN